MARNKKNRALRNNIAKFPLSENRRVAWVFATRCAENIYPPPDYTLPKNFKLETARMFGFLLQQALWHQIIVDDAGYLLGGKKKLEQLQKWNPEAIPVVALLRLSQRQKMACMEAYKQHLALINQKGQRS